MPEVSDPCSVLSTTLEKMLQSGQEKYLVKKHNAEVRVITLKSFALKCHLLITLANSLDPDQTRPA